MFLFKNIYPYDSIKDTHNNLKLIHNFSFYIYTYVHLSTSY